MNKNQPVTRGTFFQGVGLLILVMAIYSFINAYFDRGLTDEIKQTIERQCKP
jgi:hypothetical protein